MILDLYLAAKMTVCWKHVQHPLDACRRQTGLSTKVDAACAAWARCGIRTEAGRKQHATRFQTGAKVTGQHYIYIYMCLSYVHLLPTMMTVSQLMLLPACCTAHTSAIHFPPRPTPKQLAPRTLQISAGDIFTIFETHSVNYIYPCMYVISLLGPGKVSTGDI